MIVSCPWLAISSCLKTVSRFNVSVFFITVSFLTRVSFFIRESLFICAEAFAENKRITAKAMRKLCVPLCLLCVLCGKKKRGFNHREHRVGTEEDRGVLHGK